MTNAEFIEILKNDDPNAQVDFKILYGNGELKPVVHGKWIPRQIQFDALGIEDVVFECDQCHEMNAIEKPFCPNCGCQMDRGIEE